MTQMCGWSPTQPHNFSKCDSGCRDKRSPTHCHTSSMLHPKYWCNILLKANQSFKKVLTRILVASQLLCRHRTGPCDLMIGSLPTTAEPFHITLLVGHYSFYKCRSLEIINVQNTVSLTTQSSFLSCKTSSWQRANLWGVIKHPMTNPVPGMQQKLFLQRTSCDAITTSLHSPPSSPHSNTQDEMYLIH